MDIKKIDKNFQTKTTFPEDIEWFSVTEEPFCVHGIFYSEEEGCFRRLPKDVADATNEGVSALSTHTAGGRARFSTDSPYIAIRAVEPFEPPMSHMTVCGKCGFSLFINNAFGGVFMPEYDQILAVSQNNEDIVFDGLKCPMVDADAEYEATLFFPLYSAVKELYIGLKKGSRKAKAKPYMHSRPVLFYGSSITQGGCATKPADDYVNRLSRMLDTDIYNLGFSGSAKGEKAIAEYIAAQNPSVFVLDYDHNAPTAEHLQQTHYPLYQTIRNMHKSTPIVFMTMPSTDGYQNLPFFKERKVIIEESYKKATSSGDKNVYLVDCNGCFGALYGGECGTVDDCHPDSLGFLRMAERVYPVLDQVLNVKK